VESTAQRSELHLLTRGHENVKADALISLVEKQHARIRSDPSTGEIRDKIPAAGGLKNIMTQRKGFFTPLVRNAPKALLQNLRHL